MQDAVLLNVLHCIAVMMGDIPAEMYFFCIALVLNVLHRNVVMHCNTFSGVRKFSALQ